ncbi:hypothetical protein BVRB_7g158370 [Beta vulgaris subsp. vulgaris]|nr:hypothetical protein BVRB_7g158370 [Beta vulgaris subsp. vulgaris]
MEERKLWRVKANQSCSSMVRLWYRKKKEKERKKNRKKKSRE